MARTVSQAVALSNGGSLAWKNVVSEAIGPIYVFRLTTAVQPRRLLPRMMPQRPTAVGCNRWLGGRWALKDFDRVVVAWLWLLNRKPRGPRNRRLERVEQAMLVDRELPRHVVAGER